MKKYMSVGVVLFLSVFAFSQGQESQVNAFEVHSKGSQVFSVLALKKFALPLPERAIISESYNGKFMSNYIILDSRILHRGMASPDLRKNVVAVVDVMLEFDILVVPTHCVLSKCIYVSATSDENNIDLVYYTFRLENDNLSSEILDKILIIVTNNGMSAVNIRKLENLSVGDVLPLFVIASTVYPTKSTIACVAIPNFDDEYSPVFKFTPKMLETGKFANLAKGKLVPDKNYKLIGGEFMEVKTAQPSALFDFLDDDQLVEYISTLSTL